MAKSAALLPLLAAAAAPAAWPKTKPRPLIIDTDMSGDVDDVGAVCVAHALMARGEAELLAVVHNTGIHEGVGAISAINSYYGKHVPIGAYKGQFDIGMIGPYVADLAHNFPTRVQRASQVPDAVDVYRRALAGAEPHSVWISSIGFPTNLEALLRSGADAASPLNGTELVAAKVAGMAVMGGTFPRSNGHPNHNCAQQLSLRLLPKLNDAAAQLASTARATSPGAATSRRRRSARRPRTCSSTGRRPSNSSSRAASWAGASCPAARCSTARARRIPAGRRTSITARRPRPAARGARTASRGIRPRPCSLCAASSSSTHEHTGVSP